MNIEKIAEQTIISCKRVNDQFQKKDYEKDKLTLAVDALIWDLSDRRGLGHQWEAIGTDIKTEIAGIWKEIIKQSLDIK